MATTKATKVMIDPALLIRMQSQSQSQSQLLLLRPGSLRLYVSICLVTRVSVWTLTKKILSCGYGLSFWPVPVMSAIGTMVSAELGQASDYVWFVPVFLPAAGMLDRD